MRRREWGSRACEGVRRRCFQFDAPLGMLAGEALRLLRWHWRLRAGPAQW